MTFKRVFGYKAFIDRILVVKNDQSKNLTDAQTHFVESTKDIEANKTRADEDYKLVDKKIIEE